MDRGRKNLKALVFPVNLLLLNPEGIAIFLAIMSMRVQQRKLYISLLAVATVCENYQLTKKFYDLCDLLSCYSFESVREDWVAGFRTSSQFVFRSKCIYQKAQANGSASECQICGFKHQFASLGQFRCSSIRADWNYRFRKNINIVTHIVSVT